MPAVVTIQVTPVMAIESFSKLGSHTGHVHAKYEVRNRCKIFGELFCSRSITVKFCHVIGLIHEQKKIGDLNSSKVKEIGVWSTPGCQEGTKIKSLVVSGHHKAMS